VHANRAHGLCGFCGARPAAGRPGEVKIGMVLQLYGGHLCGVVGFGVLGILLGVWVGRDRRRGRGEEGKERV
jgi:hypothetical protein